MNNNDSDCSLGDNMGDANANADADASSPIIRRRRRSYVFATLKDMLLNVEDSVQLTTTAAATTTTTTTTTTSTIVAGRAPATATVGKTTETIITTKRITPTIAAQQQHCDQHQIDVHLNDCRNKAMATEHKDNVGGSSENNNIEAKALTQNDNNNNNNNNRSQRRYMRSATAASVTQLLSDGCNSLLQRFRRNPSERSDHQQQLQKDDHTCKSVGDKLQQQQQHQQQQQYKNNR